MTQLLQNAAYGTALILAAALLRRLLKDRLIPEARLALWAVCLFRLLTPAAPESVLSLWGLFAKPAPAPVQTPQLYIPMTTPAPAPQPSASGFPWEMALGLVWLGVGLALAVRYILSWRQTRRAVADAIPLERDDPRYLPLPRCARLREGPMEGAPLTFGAVRPTVVLSPGLSGEELACVLAHEGVHARRRDNLWHYAAALALAVHWWNPAVWLMSRLLRRDIELACDRAALNKLGADRRGDYARALVSLATQDSGPSFCQTFGRKAAEERIRSIMKFKKTSVIGVVFSLTLVLTVTAAFASEPKELDKYDGVKDHISMELLDKTLYDSIVFLPDLEDTKDIQSDFPEVDPDDVDMSLMREKYAKKVADGQMTQEEADQRLADTEDLLEQARRGELKLFMATDRNGEEFLYGSGVRRMYYQDENGDLIPIDPGETFSSYVLDPVVLPTFDTFGNSVSADGGVIGEKFYEYDVVTDDSPISGGVIGQMFGDYDMVVDGSHVSGSLIWTPNGSCALCNAKDCDVSYDHCHVDGKVVRVYQKDPGLLCAHPDCDNDKPHQHDGVQYAGKAPEAYVILDPEMDPRFLNDDGSPIITVQDDSPCEPAIPMTLEQYEALLDGLVSKGQMSRKDADGMLDSAKENMKGQTFPYLWAMESSGSYMVTGRPLLCTQSGCHNNGVHAHDGVYYTGCANQGSASSLVSSAMPVSSGRRHQNRCGGGHH